jgi:PhzF family phenazine biosynthesis protein
MQLKMFQVDAFADKLFFGNPAAVVILEQEIDQQLMQSIAAENNLSETAFVNINKSPINIRWFTPVAEVRLCGHATLAAARVLFENYPESTADDIAFQSKSGFLKAFQKAGHIYLDFPADRRLESVDKNEAFERALGERPMCAFKGKDDYLVIYESQSQIERIKPKFTQIANFDSRGVVISAAGEDFDFVSRCFFPKMGVNEDPVTGSAHTMLTPYWATLTNKTELTARQLSARGGTLNCYCKDDRVFIGGASRIFFDGTIYCEN